MTDTFGSYAAAVARLAQLVGVEQAYQPTCLRKRVMRRFKSAVSAQQFLDAFSRVGAVLGPARHRLAAAAATRATESADAGYRSGHRGGADGLRCAA